MTRTIDRHHTCASACEGRQEGGVQGAVRAKAVVKYDRRRVRRFAVTLEMHDPVAPAHLLVTTQVEGAAKALLPTDHRRQLGDGLEEPQCPAVTRLNVQ